MVFAYSLAVKTQKKTDRGMHFRPTIFAELLKPLDRRQFAKIVDLHNGDERTKTFTSWDHLIVLIFAQFSSIQGLRGLEASWNANAQHHYHLGTSAIARSTWPTPIR